MFTETKKGQKPLLVKSLIVSKLDCFYFKLNRFNKTRQVI